ncbi:protein ALP1-like [Ixodes scapularis]|uniref:protein ALP1-like n=1 Tax=Ixodes scapularis TaxID=6945 RepID=UPI001A9FFD4A|nr:protein ALP1-like [Ixodes scapularis]
MSKKKLDIQNILYQELLESDPVEYRRLLRVGSNQFADILSSIASCIQKLDTQMRPAIPAKDKLQLTLRFLASGESQHSSSRQFRISQSAVNGFLVETCDAIYKMLGPKYLVSPRTKDEWLAVMKNFFEIWQFPQCIGALDGKHATIIKPPKSRSVFFNYKKTFSIVIFALVDADSRSLYIDVGAPGSNGDGGVRRTTPLRNAIENGTAGLPISGPGPVGVPPVIVGDDAFPLSKYLMKPYTGTNLIEEKIKPSQTGSRRCVWHSVKPF